MRSRVMGLGLVVALAACQDAGVAIIVYPSTDPTGAPVDEIRLYVGYGAGEDGPFASKGYAPNRDRLARAWREDTDVPYAHQTITSPTQAARFVFETRGEGDRIAVVAVGMTQGRPTSVISRIDIEIPSDKLAIYRLGLNPAADPVTTSPSSLSTVQLWGGEDGQACVWVHTRHPGNLLPTNPELHDVYIGLYDDGDCDTYKRDDTAKECDDRWYEASTVPSASTLSCMKDDMGSLAGMPVPICVLGGSLCEDGAGGAIACSVARPYCAPLALCAACTEDDPLAQFRCAIDPERHRTPAARVCPVAAERQPDNTYQICAQELVLQTFTAAATQCTGAATFHGASVDGLWSSNIPLVGTSLDIAPVVPANLCTVKLYPRLPMETFRATELPVGGLIAFPLVDGRGAVIPVEFTLNETICDASAVQTTCSEPAGGGGGSADVPNCLAGTPSN